MSLDIRVYIKSSEQGFLQSLVPNPQVPTGCEEGNWVRKLDLVCVWFGSRIHQVIDKFLVHVQWNTNRIGGRPRVEWCEPNPNPHSWVG